MKRIYNLFVLLCVGLFFTTCKKDTHSSLPNADPFIAKAKAYFLSVSSATSRADNPRAVAARTVRWDQATVVNLSVGRAVLVPVRYDKELFIRTTQGGPNNFHLSNLTHLLVYQSKGLFHAEVITGFPDTNYLWHPRGHFSGIVYVEDWVGNALAKYLYEQGGAIRKAVPGSVAAAVPPPAAVSASVSPAAVSVAPSNVVTIEVCYQITGYNYSTASPDEGFAWSEAPVCRPSMVPVDDDPVAVDYGDAVGGASGGGGTASSSSAASFSIAIGHNLIANIADYFKCFINTPFSTYQVMVCVDQPKPGTRDAWTFSASDGSVDIGGKTNPFDVGHTFLVFTETTGGNVITRNVGFYPTTLVQPLSPIAKGALNDDEMHAYNISGSFTVSSTLFFNMLTNVEQNSKNTYDLDNNNCTTFAINALAAGHIYLPSTIGSWLFGMGNDPGDLGEDIRATNFVGMTRSTDQTVHMNAGVCN
ncbi:MAG TPA: hypothetical protein VNS58_01040 [Puia sp.]|nr:hypothetical protein [Puia sp.]